MTQFGVQYNGASMGSVIGGVEFAERAEAWGYDAYFVPDIETFPALDPMTLLAAVSQRTQRMALGTGVMALPLRTPYQLAKIAVSVDQLSGGRLQLGVGTGIFPGDFHVEQVDIHKRGAITNEYIEVLRRLLDGETVTFSGEHYAIENTALSPAPSRRVPLWLGGTWSDNGFSPAALRRAARYADTFHPHEVPIAGYADAIAQVQHLAEDYGRDPSAITWACNMWLCFGDSKQSAMREVDEAMKRRYGHDAWTIDPDSCIAFGTPADVIEKIEGYADAGVSTFIMNVLSTPDHVLDYFETFATEVIPDFRANAT